MRSGNDGVIKEIEDLRRKFQEEEYKNEVLEGRNQHLNIQLDERKADTDVSWQLFR